MVERERLVADAKPAFDKFIAGIRFEKGKPAWKLPAGWVEETGPESSVRIRIAAKDEEGKDAKLEILVQTLPFPEDADVDEIVKMSINLWREKLGLYTLEGEQRDYLDYFADPLRQGDVQIFVIDMIGPGRFHKGGAE